MSKLIYKILNPWNTVLLEKLVIAEAFRGKDKVIPISALKVYWGMRNDLFLTSSLDGGLVVDFMPQSHFSWRMNPPVLLKFHTCY